MQNDVICTLRWISKRNMNLRTRKTKKNEDNADVKIFSSVASVHLKLQHSSCTTHITILHTVHDIEIFKLKFLLLIYCTQIFKSWEEKRIICGYVCALYLWYHQHIHHRVSECPERGITCWKCNSGKPFPLFLVWERHQETISILYYTTAYTGT